MSKLTYTARALHGSDEKPLVWLHVGHQSRVIYRIDDDAIVIAEVFAKETARVLSEIIEVSRQRLRRYDDAQAKAQSPGS